MPAHTNQFNMHETRRGLTLVRFGDHADVSSEEHLHGHNRLPFVETEANFGAVSARVISDDPATAETTELGLTGGLTLSIEFDEWRDANVTGGYGYQRFQLQGDGDAAVVAAPMRFAYAGSIGDRGWSVRPRGYFGVGIDRSGEGDRYLDLYMGVGASLHVQQGLAVHLSAGPLALAATHRDAFGPGGDYRGMGGQVRIRVFRMLSRDCDPTSPRSEAGDPFKDPC